MTTLRSTATGEVVSVVIETDSLYYEMVGSLDFTYEMVTDGDQVYEVITRALPTGEVFEVEIFFFGSGPGDSRTSPMDALLDVGLMFLAGTGGEDPSDPDAKPLV
jgi:hypothetical protein